MREVDRKGTSIERETDSERKRLIKRGGKGKKS